MFGIYWGQCYKMSEPGNPLKPPQEYRSRARGAFFQKQRQPHDSCLLLSIPLSRLSRHSWFKWWQIVPLTAGCRLLVAPHQRGPQIRAVVPGGSFWSAWQAAEQRVAGANSTSLDINRAYETHAFRQPKTFLVGALSLWCFILKP